MAQHFVLQGQQDCRVATQGSGPDMRLSSCVPRRVPPARAVGAVCAVPLLRGCTTLPTLLRAITFERILAWCPAQEPAVHCRYNYRSVHCRSRECRTRTVLASRVAQPALVTLDSLFAFARPAPLCVACLSFGFVDADLPASRCRRCRQSVEPANTSLLTARRLRQAGLR